MPNAGALSTVALENLTATTLGPNGTGQITAALLDAVLNAMFQSFDNQVDNSLGLITPNWLGAPYGAILAGVLRSANFNATTDQAIPIVVPTPKYRISEIVVANASASLAGAVGGIYSAAAKTGVAIVPSSQAYSGLSSAAVNTLNSSIVLASTNFATAEFNLNQIFLSLTTPLGSAATADVYVFTRPLT